MELRLGLTRVGLDNGSLVDIIPITCVSGERNFKTKIKYGSMQYNGDDADRCGKKSV